MSDYDGAMSDNHRPHEWPWSPPPELPPPSLADALATPLHEMEGCWIESRCRGCGNLKGYPVRTLLTERPKRAGMSLLRGVEALLHCDKCDRWGIELALVSDPRWRESRVAGKPPNWSMVLSGSLRGTVAFTEPPLDIR